MNKVNKATYILFISFLLLLSGCSRNARQGTVIATVNGEPIYLKELQRELSMRVRQDPSLAINKAALRDMMDTLIERQIIVQEAMKRNMAKEESFVDTIKLFWEQTLIRDFIEYKSRQFDDYVFVTDKEVEDYYDILEGEGSELPPFKEIYPVIKARVEQTKRLQAFDSWLEGEKKKSRVSVHEETLAELEEK